GYNMCCSTYWPELLPTRIRGTGMGWFQVCGRLGGILGAIIVGYIVGAGGYDGVFYLIVACNVLSVLLIAWLGKETKGMVAD
ncbi:MAG TPA: MFS transporter, partial [Syntrophomonas sp.]|nr:MFS transporter [Syntrophomonas sp.]